MYLRLLAIALMAVTPVTTSALAPTAPAVHRQQDDDVEKIDVKVPSKDVKSELERRLGDGSGLSVDDKNGDRHLTIRISDLRADCGDLLITGTIEQNGQGGTLTISTTKPIKLSGRAEGHKADQSTAPSSTITVTIDSLTASVSPKGSVDVTIPARVESSDRFIPFTDAKHKKKFGVRTTTRAWAGPEKFSVEINLTLRVTALANGRGVSLQILDWAPRDKKQQIKIGGWVRLPKLLRSFNPDLAGTIQPLDTPNVRVSVEGFGERTVSNPIVAIMTKLKGKKFTLAD